MDGPKPEIVRITREELEELANMAAEKAFTHAKDQFYLEVGRSVTDKVFIFVGTVFIALYLYFTGKLN